MATEPEGRITQTGGYEERRQKDGTTLVLLPGWIIVSDDGRQDVFSPGTSVTLTKGETTDDVHFYGVTLTDLKMASDQT